MIWRNLSTEVEERIFLTLQSMVGTPYRTNDRARGVGFDCRTSVAYFLEKMSRLPGPVPLPRVPADAAVNHPELAARVLRVIAQSFDLKKIADRSIIEPGDILGVRTERDGLRNPAHAYIAGVRPYTAYHSPHAGACFCRSGVHPRMDIVAVYRARDKEVWR